MKALEQAIERTPDDPAPYLVYADWLQGRNDPRGELIALQHAGSAKSPAGAKARALARKLLAKHADVFLGELAAYPVGSWMMGLGLTWRFGFIENVDLDCRTYDGKPSFNAVKCIEQLLAHPSARFLRELVVHAVDTKTNDYRPVVKLLCQERRTTLERLTIDPFESWGPKKSIIGDVSTLWTSCPNLVSLHLSGNDVALGAIRLPKLRHFSIDDRTLSRKAVASICAAKWPLLESLSIRADGDKAKITVDDLLPILTGRGLAHLKDLHLAGIPDADRLCEALATSKVAAQLERLDLSENGWLTDKGAAALAARKQRWPKLQTLWVTHTSIEKAGRSAVKGLCPTVRFK